MNEEIMHILECAVIEEYGNWHKNGTPRLSQAHVDLYTTRLISDEHYGLRGKGHAIDVAYNIALLSTLENGITAFGKHWRYDASN